MNKKYLVGAVIIVVIFVAAGIYWWQRGDALLVQPPSNFPDELAETFQTELISRGIERIGHPIEGFDAFLLMRAFSGLAGADFDGVQTLEGVYSHNGGKLTFSRKNKRLISTAEKTVSREGYKTLLENLSRRLNVSLQDTRSIPLIIDSLGGVGRAALYENCARTEFPRSDDSSFDNEKRILTIFHENGKIELPYEPETGFAGCSEQAKAILRHLQETYESYQKDVASSVGTLAGKVTIGPLCPIIEPCPQAQNPYLLRKVVIQPIKGGITGKEIFIALDADGRFELKGVPSGVYKFTITNCDYLRCNYALPKTVLIETDKTTKVDIDIDTGIR